MPAFKTTVLLYPLFTTVCKKVAHFFPQYGDVSRFNAGTGISIPCTAKQYWHLNCLANTNATITQQAMLT